MKKIVLFLMVALSMCSVSFAKNNTLLNNEGLNRTGSVSVSQVRKVSDIVQELAVPDIESGGRIVISQNEEVNALVQQQVVGMVNGYRVQMFSSNNGQKARNKAFEIKTEIVTKHPNIEIYVTFNAPFWRVRVGNCLTKDAAQELRLWIIKEFPKYASETYIVPDVVVIQ